MIINILIPTNQNANKRTHVCIYVHGITFRQCIQSEVDFPCLLNSTHFATFPLTYKLGVEKLNKKKHYYYVPLHTYTYIHTYISLSLQHLRRIPHQPRYELVCVGRCDGGKHVHLDVVYARSQRYQRRSIPSSIEAYVDSMT